MGSSLSFHADVDSPSSPGQKSVLSDAIDGMTAPKLLDGMEKYVRDGKTATGKESKFEVIDKGDYVVIFAEFQIPALFGGGSVSSYNTYHFFKDKMEMHSKFYQSQTHFENGDHQCTMVTKIHSDPVKVEFWADFNECRGSGLIMGKMLGKVLEEMGSSAKAVQDCPSPSDPTKLTVLSDEIKDGDISPETFLTFFRKFIVETMGGTELPDDTIIEERGSDALEAMGLASKSFAKHEIKQAENHVSCHEFGEDESMMLEIGITHVQVHTAPFRLEQYNISKAGRRSGPTQAKTIETFIGPVIKQLLEQ